MSEHHVSLSLVGNRVIAVSEPIPEELRAAYERIAELEDLARNVAGFDLRLVNNFNVVQAALIEWHDQAQEIL